MDDFNKYLFASEHNFLTNASTSHLSATASSEMGSSPLVKISNTKKSSSVNEQITNLEHQISKCMAELESGNIRASLLKHHHEKVDHLLMQVDKISKQILEKYERLTKLNDRSSLTNPVYFMRRTDMDGQLESPCMKHIRETFEDTSSYFTKEYSIEAGLTIDANEEHHSKDDLLTKTESIYNGYSAEEIHQALLSNIRRSTNDLKDETDNINLKTDAQNLKFKFENGKLKDVSTKPVLLQTVKQLIEESQIAHLDKFLQCEKSKNEAADLRERLSSLNEQISTVICENYDADKNFRKYLLVQQELNAVVSCLAYLQSQVAKLSDEKRTKDTSMSSLMKKYKRIKSFDRTVEKGTSQDVDVKNQQSKQLMIQNLIKTNGSAKARHKQQHQDIIDLVEKKLVLVQEQIFNCCEDYKHLVQNETSHFLAVPVDNLKCLKNTGDQRIAARDLSVQRFNSYYDQPGEVALSEVLTNIGAPSYAPAENILPLYSNLKAEEYQTRKNAGKMKEYEELSKRCYTQILRLKEQLNTAEKEEVHTYLPSVKESQEKASQIMTECVKFRNATEIWWEQPAQTTVPWMKEDDLNVQQYLERFQHNADIMKKMQVMSS